MIESAPAAAGALREPVMELLNTYEGAPTTAQLAALGDGVADELMDIAEDTAVASSRRGRAVSALGGFPSDDTWSFLNRQLGDDAAKSLVDASRAKMVSGITRSTSLSWGSRRCVAPVRTTSRPSPFYHAWTRGTYSWHFRDARLRSLGCRRGQESRIQGLDAALFWPPIGGTSSESKWMLRRSAI